MAGSNLILGVFKGRYTTRKLPVGYYKNFSAELLDNVKTGMRGRAKQFAELNENLELNAQAFAAAKTWNIVNDLQTAAQGIKNFSDFESIGQAIVTKYENWGEAEANTAKQQAIQAAQWKVIEDDSDLFPLLKYSTIGDACSICKPLDGLTAPVGDKVWAKIYPCNHYNCYCIVTQETKGTQVTDPAVKQQLYEDSVKLMSPVFASNPGKTEQLFTKDHPYFDVPKDFRKFAKENFGLPIK